MKTSRARSGRAGVPRFLCCHKARWSGTSGGRIAESGHGPSIWRRGLGAHANDRGGVDTVRCPRMNGGAATPASQNRRARTGALLQLSQSLPTAAANSGDLAQTFAMLLHLSCFCGLTALADYGLDCSRSSAVSRLFATLISNRASQKTAPQRLRRRLFAIQRAAIAFFPSPMTELFGLTSGSDIRTPSLLADKILFDQKSVTVGDRLDQTRLWAPSLPVISPCVQLVAHFLGGQPALGASKMMVYRLRRNSLINRGRCLIQSVDLFRLFRNYIQNE